MKIALITYDDQGKYTSDVENEDLKLFEFLKNKGVNIKFEIWSDPTVSWTEYDLGIIKSPWDYFDRQEEFKNWLDKIESLNIPLLNPVQVIKWNLDKHYLQDIANAGLAVTPTSFLEKDTQANLSDYFDQFNTETLIVKPAISGGSKNTFKFKKEESREISRKITDLLRNEAFMVQPFLKEIQSEGEWSLIFFNGKFSHCLLKKAKENDFRVQHSLGGTIHPQIPSEDLLKQAQQYVELFAKECLYCRVDGVLINGMFYLMELELIEPFLFLFTEPESYERYFQALQEKIYAFKINN